MYAWTTQFHDYIIFMGKMNNTLHFKMRSLANFQKKSTLVYYNWPNPFHPDCKTVFSFFKNKFSGLFFNF